MARDAIDSSALLPGGYEVVAEAAGFQRSTHPEFRLPVETTWTVDFRLDVAGDRRAGRGAGSHPHGGRHDVRDARGPRPRAPAEPADQTHADGRDEPRARRDRQRRVRRHAELQRADGGRRQPRGAGARQAVGARCTTTGSTRCRWWPSGRRPSTGSPRAPRPTACCGRAATGSPASASTSRPCRPGPATTPPSWSDSCR